MLTALQDEQTTNNKTINVNTAPLISHKAMVSSVVVFCTPVF